MSSPVRIGLVVGELSGDNLGVGLMRAIKQLVPDVQFEGIGGPKMVAEGMLSLADQERLAVMGYVEPLKRLPELLGIRKKVRDHFLDNPPAAFIGIDSPGFNLGLEKNLRKAGIKTVHYVSPQVWAWRQGRVKKIARCVDLMLTLFPFEAEFYREHDIPVSFVGHTLADTMDLDPDTLAARDRLGLAQVTTAQKVVALLPGSRGSEVKLLAANFLSAAEQIAATLPDVHFIIPAATTARYQQIEQALESYPELPVTLLQGQSHDVMCAADVVVMASGTTTLEAMLLKKPMVVAYRFPALSYAILSRLLKIPYISLPNILAGKELVPELLQDAVTADGLAKEVLAYFADSARVAALQGEFLTIHKTLKQNADEKAATAIIGLINASH
ncbi:lipid-A-disaccharide synthase [Aurantivibrio plasticivorans]